MTTQASRPIAALRASLGRHSDPCGAGAARRGWRASELALSRILHRQHPQLQHAAGVCTGLGALPGLVRCQGDGGELAVPDKTVHRAAGSRCTWPCAESTARPAGCDCPGTGDTAPRGADQARSSACVNDPRTCGTPRRAGELPISDQVPHFEQVCTQGFDIQPRVSRPSSRARVHSHRHSHR